MFNHSELMNLLTEIRYIAIKGNEKRIDFENKSLSDSYILTLTNISKRNFDALRSEVQGHICESSTRCVRTYLGISLTKLRTNITNKILSTLFNFGRNSV